MAKPLSLAACLVVAWIGMIQAAQQEEVFIDAAVEHTARDLLADTSFDALKKASKSSATKQAAGGATGQAATGTGASASKADISEGKQSAAQIATADKDSSAVGAAGSSLAAGNSSAAAGGGGEQATANSTKVAAAAASSTQNSTSNSTTAGGATASAAANGSAEQSLVKDGGESSASTAADVTGDVAAGSATTAASNSTAAQGTGADVSATGAAAGATAAGSNTTAVAKAGAATAAGGAATAAATNTTSDGAAGAAAAAGAARRLLEKKARAGAGGASDAIHADKGQQDVSGVLMQLGMDTSIPAAALAAANAPIAKCLRAVIQTTAMSISPNIPELEDACKAEVQEFLAWRAGDVRNDPPLVAHCAADIAQRCKNVTDPTRVLGCLKRVKANLQPSCRSAVTARQAAAAEDMSMDPDLQRDCGAEREKHCADAGWGTGAGQACLMEHLRATVPDLFAHHAPAGSSNSKDPLSKACAAALVQRLIEESEDVRFNWRVAAACAPDKHALCRGVRPGNAEVLQCLERHMTAGGMGVNCREALEELQQLRSLDSRLDHPFVAACAPDVKSLCEPEVAAQLAASAADVAFGTVAPFECMRKHLSLLKDGPCRSLVTSRIVWSYKDSRLDGGLMHDCKPEVVLLCSNSPQTALSCLQEKLDKFSQDDTPEVLQGKISQVCQMALMERQLQAASNIAFIPELHDACGHEHTTLCAAAGLEGARALDCLADHRNAPSVSARCRKALRSFLVEAAQDIRTMGALRQDCEQDMLQLCKGLQPGQGRVVACLRQRRANITGDACRRQVLRLLGVMVEDHRADAQLAEACAADISKYCGGVPFGDGAVHDCLRRSLDHLSPPCRDAEEQLEQLEHEDVRLNPKILRECPLAISMFCADMQDGQSQVISCLQHNMGKGHFPAGCKAVLTVHTDRATTKYSLNAQLKAVCQPNVEALCANATDDAGSNSHAATATGTSAHYEETTLACLARNAADLDPPCRSELQQLVKLSLDRYRVGMPITSQCDGDVMARCQVDQISAPYLEPGYVLRCLAKHAAQLHKPCWSLISSMGDGQQLDHAVQLERSYIQGGAAGGAGASAQDDARILEKVALEIRRDLEPRIFEQVSRNVQTATKNVTATVTSKVTLALAKTWGASLGGLAPKINALMHTTVTLLVLLTVGLVAGVVLLRRYFGSSAPLRGGGMLVVKKDGRV